MAVSVPEKTLEHWVSQYILYRFRSHALMWWPSAGVDIDVFNVPTRPGKLLAIEVKTATWTGSRHVILVDVAQLKKYLARNVADQPFYAFPLPTWTGELPSNANEAERALSRSGDRWFALGMAVLTTVEVAARLGITTSTTSNTPLELCVVEGSPGQVRWVQPSAKGLPPRPRGWHEFWRELIECGNPHWPQRFHVASHHLPDGPTFSNREAISAMHATRREIDESEDTGDITFVVLQPDGEGNYIIQDRGPSSIGTRNVSDQADSGGHRVAVFLAAAALQT